MDKTAGAILLVIGVVALFAAIVGGGVKIREIEVGSLPSRWRQGFLAIFGIVVAITGLIMVMDPPGPDSGGPEPQNADTSGENDASATGTTADTNAADQNDENTAGNADGNESTTDNSAEDSTPS